MILPRPAPCAPASRGFTLVEVLVALLVAVLLVGALAPALISSLRLEETALAAQVAEFGADTVQARLLERQPADPAPEGLSMRREDVEIEQDKRRIRWAVWTLAPRERVSAASRVAWRIEERPASL